MQRSVILLSLSSISIAMEGQTEAQPPQKVHRDGSIMNVPEVIYHMLKYLFMKLINKGKIEKDVKGIGMLAGFSHISDQKTEGRW